MKLLIFGGDRYGERRRIPAGGWIWYRPEYTAHLNLEDGLSSDDAFGVGTRGESLFLCLRRLVPTGRTRPYPLTVLFDPEEEGWRGCGWNSAALAAALVAPEGKGAEILHRSDVVASERLAAVGDSVIRESLQYRLKSGAPALAELKFVMVGAALEGGSAKLLLSDVCAGHLPDAKTMAKLLEELPVCFRIGRGWLVGSTRFVADAIGAALFIGEMAANVERTPAAPLLALGKAVLETCEELQRDEESAQHLAPFLDGPSLIRTDPEAAAFFRFLRAFAAVRVASQWDANADKLIAESAHLDRFSRSVAPVLDAIVAKTERPFGSEAASYILRRVRVGQVYPPAVVRRLDDRALLDDIFANTEPDASSPSWPPGIAVSSVVRAKAIVRHMETADIGRLPNIVVTSFEDFGDLDDSGANDFLDIAVRRWSADGRKFTPWRAVTKNASVPDRLNSRIADVVRAKMRQAPANWIHDFVAFVDKPGAVTLQGFSAGTWRSVIEALLDDLGEDEIAWLRRLVFSGNDQSMDLTTICMLKDVSDTWHALAILKTLAADKEPGAYGLSRQDHLDEPGRNWIEQKALRLVHQHPRLTKRVAEYFPELATTQESHTRSPGNDRFGTREKEHRLEWSAPLDEQFQSGQGADHGHRAATDRSARTGLFRWLRDTVVDLISTRR
jgi:hypothetical protein